MDRAAKKEWGHNLEEQIKNTLENLKMEKFNVK